MYFAESAEQDQTAHTCSLILLCTIQLSIINYYQRKPCPLSYSQLKLIYAIIVTLISEGQLFTERQNLRLVEILNICRRQIKCDRKIEICFRKGRKHCGKRRKCWLPAFSLFPTMFSKCFLFKVVKSRDGVVYKELTWNRSITFGIYLGTQQK